LMLALVLTFIEDELLDHDLSTGKDHVLKHLGNLEPWTLCQ